ncbi:hypothetical protein CPB86DRAFT_784137 [Serendipita vermifera]|nr:hypothetical protein CPB86DRAFT_784137 [Serendipita vermifera]
MLIHTLSLTLVDPNPSVSFHRFCKITPWTLTLGNGLVVICIAAALIARIHALWQKLWLLRALLAAFAVIFLGNFIFFAYFIIRSPPAAPTSFPKPFTGCAWFPMITSGWIPFLTSGAFETVCVALTLWGTWSVENRRDTPTRYLLFKEYASHSLIYLMLNDPFSGVLYYIFIIAIKVFAVMSTFYPQISAFGAANGILAFSSMVCSMLYTRLRSVANHPYGLSPYATPDRSYRTGSTDKVPQSRVVFSLTSESAWSSSESLKSYWANEKPLPPLPTHHSRIISSLPRPKSTRVELLANRAGLDTNV